MGTTTSGAMSSGKETKRKDKPLSPNEQSILAILQTGGHFPAKELGKRTHDRDPRSTIRYLRGRGISILDYWVGSGSNRYKHYYLVGGGPTNVQLNLFPAK